MLKRFPKTILALFSIGLVTWLCCQKAEAQAPITGNITFTGSVNLDSSSVNTATMVTAWHGLGTGDKPQVQDVDPGSTFDTQGVMPGDATTFSAPWSFNTPPGTISNPFWSVDGFTFSLLTSQITQQGGGSLAVQGTGNVAHAGFTTTPGTFSFTTQDPSAGAKFSFSAATAAVPEPASFVLLALGGASLLGRRLVRAKKNRGRHNG